MSVSDKTVAAKAQASIGVLIVDNHDLVGSSLASVLGMTGIPSSVVSRASLSLNGVLEAVAAYRASHSNLVPIALVDLNLTPELDGVDLITPLKSIGVSVIILTGVTDRLRLAKCVAAGASGIFNKGRPLQELMELIKAVACGETAITSSEKELLLRELNTYSRRRREAIGKLSSLTPKEQIVLAKLQSGMLAEEIARESYVSLLTVRSQIHWILTKLDVHSQRDAVALANQVNWNLGETYRRARRNGR